ncbi:MAG: hypothetical protein QXU99_07335 [Candidatus Bathyarchaeia archaeon]
MQKTQRLFIGALFSSVIFITHFFVPPPVNYLLIAVQALSLALATFFVGRAGATYVGLIGGALAALARPAFGPFTFLFTFLYGVIVDIFIIFFHASPAKNGVNSNRVMLAMALSTGIVGFSSYYVFSSYLKLIDFNPLMSALVLFAAIGCGLSAGYAAAYLWNKYLKSISA